MTVIPEISPEELKHRLDAGEKFTILDVREPWELAIARLPGVIHIPLGELPGRLAEIDRRSPLVVMCKVGGRSMRAAQFLAGHGFEPANLSGGIDAWAQRVDPTLATY